MAKIVRYDGNLQAFASAAPGTERTIFGDVTQANDLTSQISAGFLRGWGIVGPSDQPALEDFNGAMYTHGQLLAYLHQVGVPEYNAAQEYHIGSFVNSGSALWVSRVDSNIGNPPASSPTQWFPVSSGRLINVQVITSTATYTPTAGTNSVVVELIGAGGGSGSIRATGGASVSVSGGGGGGGYAMSRLTAGFSGALVTIGAGGTAGAIGANNAGTGLNTSFGALLQATGGAGGSGDAPIVATSASQLVAGGAPGAATGGNMVNSSGAKGGVGLAINADIYGGQGGVSGRGSQSGAQGIQNGAGQPAAAGIAGVGGRAIIWEYT